MEHAVEGPRCMARAARCGRAGRPRGRSELQRSGGSSHWPLGSQPLVFFHVFPKRLRRNFLDCHFCWLRSRTSFAQEGCFTRAREARVARVLPRGESPPREQIETLQPGSLTCPPTPLGLPDTSVGAKRLRSNSSKRLNAWNRRDDGVGPNIRDRGKIYMQGLLPKRLAEQHVELNS